MKYKHVKQLDCTGCGIACVAMVVNSSYEEVKQTARKHGINRSKNIFYTNFKDLSRLLRQYSFKTESKRKFNRWKDIPGTAIVSTNRRKGKAVWHWVLFVKTDEEAYILDPARGKRKIKEFRGRSTGYYLGINGFNVR